MDGECSELGDKFAPATSFFQLAQQTDCGVDMPGASVGKSKIADKKRGTRERYGAFQRFDPFVIASGAAERQPMHP